MPSAPCKTHSYVSLSRLTFYRIRITQKSGSKA